MEEGGVQVRWRKKKITDPHPKAMTVRNTQRKWAAK